MLSWCLCHVDFNLSVLPQAIWMPAVLVRNPRSVLRVQLSNKKTENVVIPRVPLFGARFPRHPHGSLHLNALNSFAFSFFQCTCEVAEHAGLNQAAWANALIGRIFWDFLREKHWADMVSHKIQKKLSKIRVRAAVACSQRRV